MCKWRRSGSSSSRPWMDISQVLPLKKWVLNVPSDHKLLRMVLLLCKVLLSLELPSLSSEHQSPTQRKPQLFKPKRWVNNPFHWTSEYDEKECESRFSWDFLIEFFLKQKSCQSVVGPADMSWNLGTFPYSVAESISAFLLNPPIGIWNLHWPRSYHHHMTK